MKYTCQHAKRMDYGYSFSNSDCRRSDGYSTGCLDLPHKTCTSLCPPIELHFLNILLLTSFPRQFSPWNFLTMHHFISPSTFRKYVLTTSLLDVFHLHSPFSCPHPLLSSPTVSLGLAHKAGTFPHVPISSRTTYSSTLKMEAARSSEAWVNF